MGPVPPPFIPWFLRRNEILIPIEARTDPEYVTSFLLTLNNGIFYTSSAKKQYIVIIE